MQQESPQIEAYTKQRIHMGPNPSHHSSANKKRPLIAAFANANTVNQRTLLLKSNIAV